MSGRHGRRDPISDAVEGRRAALEKTQLDALVARTQAEGDDIARSTRRIQEATAAEWPPAAPTG